MINKNSKILITGGHLTPAIAVLNELKKRGFNNFVWVGHKYNQAGTSELSAEYKTVEMNNIQFVELKTGKLIRKWTPQTFFYGLKQFFLIFIGFFRSLFIILKFRPRLILSFGGYLAVPIVIWGKLLGAIVITHEQTIVTGLANKIIAKFANKVLISWENSAKFFNPSKVVLTGNPIRREVFIVNSNTLTGDFDKKLPILLIYGGNQGANEINKRIFLILDKLLQDFNVIHQTGNSTVTMDFQKAMQLRAMLPPQLQGRYLPKDYILPNEVGEALNEAEIIIGRSGANNSVEFLALGKMCILIPIPWASHDEQTKNAELIVNTGLGYLLTQSDTLTAEKIYQTILMANNQYKKNLGFNGDSIEICRAKGNSLVILDAPQRVVDEVEKLLR